MTEVTGERIARGAAWMVGARMLDRLIGLISTVVLARLLTPADFGLVAMAMSVIGLIELASAFGFEVSILRTASPTRAQYDTVWTLNLLFGLGCSGIVALAAIPTAEFYGDHRLVMIMFVLAVSWVLSSLTNVGIVDFQRTLNFSKEFSFLMFGRVVGVVVTIGLALLTRSYWALIVGSVTTRLMGLMLSYAWHPFRPRLSLTASRDLFSFSIWIFLTRIAAFGNSRAADFVLGRVRGAAELGLFRMGDEIGHLPGSELVAPLNRALFPGLSQMIESGRSTGALVVAATGVVGLVLFPACLGIAAVADELVRVMLGAQWLGAVPVVQILAFDALVLALWANQHTTLVAIGRPALPAAVAVARLAVFGACLFFLARDYGARGVATGALISSTFALAIGLAISLRTVGVRFSEYLRAIWRPTLASGLMWLIVRGTTGNIALAESLGSDALRLVAGVFVGIAVYTTAIWSLFLICGRPSGPEAFLEARISPTIRRWLQSSR